MLLEERELQKLNELIRLSEHDLIQGMAEVLKNQMSQQTKHEDTKKKILSTGIRVGTEVKTKFMTPYITQANPEGLYLLDLDITLDRIQTAARFIKKFDIKKVIVYSGRSYATTPIEKFCELTGAEKMLGRFMPGTLTNPSLPYYSEPKLIIVSDPQVDAQAVTEATNAGIPIIGNCQY